MRVAPSLIVSTVLDMLISGTVLADLLCPEREGRRAILGYNRSGCHGDRAARGMGPDIQHAEAGDLPEAILEGEEGGMPSIQSIVTSTEMSNIAA
jgi:hypothetical protein